MTCVREPAIGAYSSQLNPVHTHPSILPGYGSASYDPSTPFSLHIICLLQVFPIKAFYELRLNATRSTHFVLDLIILIV